MWARNVVILGINVQLQGGGGGGGNYLMQIDILENDIISRLLGYNAFCLLCHLSICLLVFF